MVFIFSLSVFFSRGRVKMTTVPPIKMEDLVFFLGGGLRAVFEIFTSYS